MRRPVLTSIAVVTVLVLLGVPFLHSHFGIVDDRILPPGASTRQVQEQMRTHFVADEPHAIRVVADIAEPATASAAIEPYALALSCIPGVVQVDALTGSYAHGARIAAPLEASSHFATARATWWSVMPSQARVDRDAFGLVQDVRALPAPFPVEVGGHIATALDLQNAVIEQAPLVVGLVMLATFLILLLMTGSVVLPLKAIVLNVLSLSATFGVLVWEFQDISFHCEQDSLVLRWFCRLGLQPAPTARNVSQGAGQVPACVLEELVKRVEQARERAKSSEGRLRPTYKQRWR